MNDRGLDRTTAALLLGALVLLYLGWREFWFMCDDAFIAFRYVNNAHLGHGYVWNPPPFRPVDGYTSFAWVAILDLVWRVSGVDPPRAANWISLVCAGATLVLVAKVARGLPWPARLRPVRPALVGLVLLGTVANRTFLAWSSSGLETALFNLTLVGWLYACVWVEPDRRGASVLLAAAACSVTLTRPDGLLFVAATVVVLLVRAALRPKLRRSALTGLATIVAVLGPFYGWRLARYGDLLPNTYYAKVPEAWPAAGLRYLGSFVLEYAAWAALLVAGWAVLVRARAGGCPRPESLVAIAALALHAGYYAAVVGGDHFEFRVLSHLVPMLFLAAAWGVCRLEPSPAVGIATLLAVVVLSWPIQWIHWWHSRDVHGRDETFALTVPVAPHLPPGPTRWYGRWFDDMQAFLIERFVCMRHAEHRAFFEFKVQQLPSREEGSSVGPKGYPVHISGEVGLLSWVFPHLVIIDGFGLNDRYVARNVETFRPKRTMGHERVPPPGYIAAFRENVTIRDGHAVVRERKKPLTAEEIERIERRYEVWLRHLE